MITNKLFTEFHILFLSQKKTPTGILFPIEQLHFLTVSNYCIANIISKRSTSQNLYITHIHLFYDLEASAQVNMHQYQSKTIILKKFSERKYMWCVKYKATCNKKAFK